MKTLENFTVLCLLSLHCVSFLSHFHIKFPFHSAYIFKSLSLLHIRYKSISFVPLSKRY